MDVYHLVLSLLLCSLMPILVLLDLYDAFDRVDLIIIIIISLLYVLICNGTTYKHKLENRLIYKT